MPRRLTAFENCKSPVCIVLLTSLLVSSCQTNEGQEWKPTVGLSTTIADDYEVSVSSLGYTGYTESLDYSVNEIELGATRVTPNGKRPIKHEFAGFKLGSGELSNELGADDLDELSWGGIIYNDKGEAIIPFFSIWATTSEYADLSISKQLGLRLGGGVEYMIEDSNASITLGADFLVPLIEAEGDVDGIPFEVDGAGFAIRLGFRIFL